MIHKKQNLAKVINISSDWFDSSYEKNIMGLHGISREKRKVFIPNLGTNITDFSRCSYLGLDNHPLIVQGAIEFVSEYNSLHWSCARTRLNFAITEDLEDKLSQIFKCNAITFSSVFLCNMAIIPLISCGAFNNGHVPDVVVFDKFCHVSLSYHKPVVEQYTKVLTIEHNDILALEEICKSHTSVAYIADGVYSMGGNCPIEDIQYLQKEYNLFAFIDDAHGISIVGEHGEGYVKSFYPTLGANTIIATSLGKGFGASGGFVMVGEKNYEDIIRRYSQPYAFSVGGNVAAIGAALGSIKIHESEELQKRQLFLRKNISLFDNYFPTEYMNSILPIRIIPMIDENSAIIFAEILLKEYNIYASAVFFPTIPQGKAALRISLTSDHSVEDIMILVEVFKENYEMNFFTKYSNFEEEILS